MLDGIKKDLEWGRKIGGRPQENLDMEQVEWLIEQAEKLLRLENLFMGEDYTTLDYLRLSAEVFEGKEIRKRLKIRRK